MQSLPNTTSQRQLTFLQFICSPGSQLKTSAYRTKGRGKSDRKEAMRTWRGGRVHRKRLTSVLCVLSVATAVSGSAEHKSHQGELSGPAGKPQQREKVSAFTKTLLLNRIAYSWVYRFTICILFPIQYLSFGTPNFIHFLNILLWGILAFYTISLFSFNKRNQALSRKNNCTI